MSFFRLFFTELEEEVGIKISTVETTTLSYRDHFEEHLGPLPNGSLPIAVHQTGGRLIPRHVLDGDSAAYSAAISDMTANGMVLVASVGNFTKKENRPDNAVLPAWRDTYGQNSITHPFNPAGP